MTDAPARSHVYRALSSGAMAECGFLVCLSLSAISFGLYIADPRVAEVHHDDGIYVATAKAIAEGYGYRLINLPGEPLQTKYPPLYSALLSLVWRVSPQFPDNVQALKAVNAALMGLILPVYAYWLRGYDSLGRVDRVVALLLFATTPALVNYSNVLLSEPLFIALVMAGLALCTRLRNGGSTKVAHLAGAIAGLAVLTRIVGLALLVAAVVSLWRRNRKAAVVIAIWGICVGVAWVGWSSLVDEVGVLQEYYVAYEVSLHRLTNRPELVGALLANNIAVLSGAAYRLAGAEVLGVFTLASIFLGAYLLWGRRLVWRGDLIFILVYVLIVLDHPMPMPRYLLPMVPFAVLCFVAAMQRMRVVVGPVAWVPILLILLMNGGVLALYVKCSAKPQQDVCGKQWAVHRGFLETAEWLTHNTANEAVIASSHDTLYYLYTGRRGIRPWRHDAHFYALHRRIGDEVTVAEASVELERWGVQCLAHGPFWDGAEGVYAREQTVRLLESDGRWRLMYESANGPQKVFCIDRDASAVPQQ